MARVKTSGCAAWLRFAASPARPPASHQCFFLFGKAIAWLQPTTSIAGQPAGRAKRPSFAIRLTLRSRGNRSGEPPVSSPVSSRTRSMESLSGTILCSFKALGFIIRATGPTSLQRDARKAPMTLRPRHFPDRLHLDENALSRSGISIFLNRAKNKFIRF